jgi:hypothetical protein
MLGNLKTNHIIHKKVEHKSILKRDSEIIVSDKLNKDNEWESF